MKWWDYKEVLLFSGALTGCCFPKCIQAVMEFWVRIMLGYVPSNVVCSSIVYCDTGNDDKNDDMTFKNQ